jgi:peroxiredoxin
MKGLKGFFIIVFFLTAFSGAYAGSDNKPAPDFSMKDVNGKDFTLSSLKGKVVILSFWATWCHPCKDEMPKFNKLYKEMRSRGLEIVAVSSDYSLGSLKDFLDKNSLDFSILYDEKRTVTRQYKIPYLPVTFLIDKSGVIVEKITGEFEWPSGEMKKKLEKLLQQTYPPSGV